MKTVATIIGIVFFVVVVAFLWMFIASADESRKHNKRDDDHIE